MYDKCPWCQHEKCEKCEEGEFLELWLGCCVCEMTASRGFERS